MNEMMIIKADAEKGIVIIPAYRANAPGADKQGDMIGPLDLWVAAANFAARPSLKLQHGTDLPPGVCRVIMSFVSGPAGYRGDGWAAKPYTWIIGLKVNLDSADGKAIWGDLKAGRIGGLSIGGRATVEEFVAEGEV